MMQHPPPPRHGSDLATEGFIPTMPDSYDMYEHVNLNLPTPTPCPGQCFVTSNPVQPMFNPPSPTRTMFPQSAMQPSVPSTADRPFNPMAHNMSVSGQTLMGTAVPSYPMPCPAEGGMPGSYAFPSQDVSQQPNNGDMWKGGRAGNGDGRNFNNNGRQQRHNQNHNNHNNNHNNHNNHGNGGHKGQNNGNHNNGYHNNNGFNPRANGGGNASNGFRKGGPPQGQNPTNQPEATRSLRQFTKQIVACGKNQQLNHALDLLSQMEAQGLNPDRIVYNALISACEKDSRCEKALQLFDDMQRKGIAPDVITYNTLISACRRGKAHEKALQLFMQMQSEGYTPDVITYSALISTYEASQQPEQAIDIFKMMLRQGLKPNVVTYSTLINVCSKSRYPEKALDVFEHMQQQGLQPNVITYSALISACEKCKRPDAALMLFLEMQRAGLTPNIITYSCLISACEKGNKPEMALEVFAAMQEQGLQPDIIIYTVLISACEKCGQPERALELFQRMQRDGHEPNVMAYGSLVTALSRSSQPQLALSFYEIMKQQKMVQNAASYAAVLNACRLCAMPEKSQEVVSDMRVKGIELTSNIYCTLLATYQEAGYHDLALKIFVEMRGRSLLPNNITSVLEMCEAGKKAGSLPNLLTMVERQGTLPVATLCHALTQSCMQGKLLAQGLELCKAAFQKNVQLSCNILCSLILACEAVSRHADAMSLARLMRSQDLPLTRATYQVLLQASIAAGEAEEALEVVGSFSAQGWQPDAQLALSTLELFLRHGGDYVVHARKLLLGIRQQSITPPLSTFAKAVTTKLSDNIQISAEGAAEDANLSVLLAQDLIQLLHHLGHVSDTITFNALMASCAKGRVPSRLLEFCETMKESSVIPELIAGEVIEPLSSTTRNSDDTAASQPPHISTVSEAATDVSTDVSIRGGRQGSKELIEGARRGSKPHSICGRRPSKHLTTGMTERSMRMASKEQSMAGFGDDDDDMEGGRRPSKGVRRNSTGGFHESGEPSRKPVFVPATRPTGRSTSNEGSGESGAPAAQEGLPGDIRLICKNTFFCVEGDDEDAEYMVSERRHSF